MWYDASLVLPPVGTKVLGRFKGCHIEFLFPFEPKEEDPLDNLEYWAFFEQKVDPDAL